MGKLIVKFIRKCKGPRIATDATWDVEQASYVASSLSHLVCLLRTPVLDIIVLQRTLLQHSLEFVPWHLRSGLTVSIAL